MEGEQSTKNWNDFGVENMTDELLSNNSSVTKEEQTEAEVDEDDQQTADTAERVAKKILEENQNQIPWGNLNNTPHLSPSSVQPITAGKEQNYRMGWNDAMAYVLSNPSFFCKMNCGRPQPNGMERERPYKTRGYKGNNYNPNYRRHNNNRHYQNHHHNSNTQPQFQPQPQQDNQCGVDDERTKSKTI